MNMYCVAVGYLTAVLLSIRSTKAFITPKSEFLLEVDGNGVSMTRSYLCVIEQKYGVEVGGKVRCWGEIFSNADLTDPPEDLNFVQVTVGRDFGCGIAVDQTVHCWGAMKEKALGLYTQISSDCDSGFACGILIDGKINCWGMGSESRIVPSITDRFIQVSCSSLHCCALDEKGYPHCWGPSFRAEVNPPVLSWKEFQESQETNGWKEDEEELDDVYADEDVPAITTDDDKRLSKVQFRQISVSNDMSCGITMIGAHLRCWGDAILHKRGKWPRVAKGPYRQVSVGGLGVCAIVASEEDISGEEDFLKVTSPEAGRFADSLECWGRANAINPSTFPAWDQIAVGVSYVCGVSMDSQLHCGGYVTPAETEFFKSVVIA